MALPISGFFHSSAAQAAPEEIELQEFSRSRVSESFERELGSNVPPRSSTSVAGEQRPSEQFDPFDPKLNIDQHPEHKTVLFDLLHSGLAHVLFGSKPAFIQQSPVVLSHYDKVLSLTAPKQEPDSNLAVIASSDLKNHPHPTILVVNKFNMRKTVANDPEAFGLSKTPSPNEIEAFIKMMSSPSGIGWIRPGEVRGDLSLEANDHVRIGTVIGYGSKNARQFLTESARPAPIQQDVEEIRKVTPDYFEGVTPFPIVYLDNADSGPVANQNFADAFDIDDFLKAGHERAQIDHPGMTFGGYVLATAIDRIRKSQE